MSPKTWAELRKNRQLLHRKVPKMMTSPFNGVRKRCTKCRVAKPLDAFAYRRGSPDKTQAYCRACMNEISRVHYWHKVNDGKINGDEGAVVFTEVMPKRQPKPTTQIEDKKEVKKMAYRSFLIDGKHWTPLMDVAIATKRAPGSVHTKAEALKLETRMIAPLPFQRRLKMVETSGLAELENALNAMPRVKYAAHRRGSYPRKWAVSPPAKEKETTTEAPAQTLTPSTIDPARQFVSKLRELKPMAAALGIKLEELVFRNGEVSFPMLKTEVVKTEVVVKL